VYYLKRLLASAALMAALIGSAQIASAENLNLGVPLPGVTVDGVNLVGPSEATVTATVDPNGLATKVFVQYGTNGVLDLKSPTVTLDASVDPTKVVAQLLGLEPGTTYGYRVVVESSAGTTTSPTTTLTTPSVGSSSTGSRVVYINLRTGEAAVGKLGKNSARCTITGTSGNDVLKGTSHRDVICGLGGNDKIVGRGGNDVLIGGSGKDRINGGKGRDRLLGNAGRDRLNARDGKRGDRVDGGKGRDRVLADKGDRVIASESVSRR
jgi:Ca2+-binding RTX toxin-like protein